MKREGLLGRLTAPTVIAMGLFLMAQAAMVRGEEANLFQRIAGMKSVGEADSTLPNPVRFGVVMELGDLEQAKVWLDQGLSPDFMGANIGSGLMIGAWEGNIPLMELFYSRGADINLENNAGEQALLLAAWKGNRVAVDWLLERGATVNRGPGKWSALHYASFSGHKELVEYLMEKGADINARSPNGSSPLMVAIYDGKQDVAKLLIERGADRTIRNDWGDGAMDWAMRFNQVNVARMIGSPEEFVAAANQPKEAWGMDQRSEKAPVDLDQLLRARHMLIAKGLPVEDVDRNIAVLRARYAKAAIAPKALPPRSSVLEITAKRAAPEEQKARIIQQPGSYRMPPKVHQKIPARPVRPPVTAPAMAPGQK